MSNSLGPCTPSCACRKCEPHRRARAAYLRAKTKARREAAYVTTPQRWEGDDS